MPMPTFPLARLGGFRSELHACFTRRADALFELGDALLCAPAIPSLPHLSLEPVHQRGWGSVYAALARGRIDTEQLRDLLVRFLPDADPLVFAVDVTTWPRCDAECSPERGYYYHPSRHSAGQPIIAGWAFQWITQLGFERDSWTAPVDARRLHPLDDTDHTAAVQVRTLLERLPAGGAVPWFVFDGGYDSAQLSLDLAEVPVAVLVRLRSDRCFYADPPPRPPGSTGRPRRHGAKFNCADPTTWPVPTATLGCQDDQYGTVTVKAWTGLHPKQQRHPATAPVGHGRSCAAPSCASRSNASRPRHVRRRCCGCGGPALAAVISIWPGGPMSAASTWSTPSGSPSRPLAGRLQGRGIPPRPTGGPGWCWLPTPSCAWPARPPTTSGCRGRCRDPSRDCRPIGCAAGFRGCCAHSAHRLPRRNPADAPRAGPRAGLLGLQSATRRSRSPPRSPGRSNPRPPRPPDQSSPFHHR
jgi:DDE superfamily endonuclease